MRSTGSLRRERLVVVAGQHDDVFDLVRRRCDSGSSVVRRCIRPTLRPAAAEVWAAAARRARTARCSGCRPARVRRRSAPSTPGLPSTFHAAVECFEPAQQPIALGSAEHRAVRIVGRGIDRDVADRRRWSAAASRYQPLVEHEQVDEVAELKSAVDDRVVGPGRAHRHAIRRNACKRGVATRDESRPRSRLVVLARRRCHQSLRLRGRRRSRSPGCDGVHLLQTGVGPVLAVTLAVVDERHRLVGSVDAPGRRAWALGMPP